MSIIALVHQDVSKSTLLETLYHLVHTPLVARLSKEAFTGDECMHVSNQLEKKDLLAFLQHRAKGKSGGGVISFLSGPLRLQGRNLVPWVHVGGALMVVIPVESTQATLHGAQTSCNVPKANNITVEAWDTAH